MNARAAAWQGSKWIRPELRLAIYARDGFCCAYCGEGAEDTKMSLDHVVAVEEGGDNSPSNLVTACLSCNSAKQDLSVREWLAYLRDKGVDTIGIAARVRDCTRRVVDRAKGKELLAQRKAARAAQEG